MLLPSVVALVLWFAASGYLVFQGFYNRAVANSVRQVSIPAVAALSSIQRERQLTVELLARPTKELGALADQRRQTDGQVAALRNAAESVLSRAPESIRTRWGILAGYLDQIPATRSGVDARSLNTQRVYTFYNELLDAATDLFDTQARVVPDVEATQGGITATEVFRASDLMSRAGSTLDAAFAAGSLGQANYLEFVRLVGAYHFGLANVSAHLEPDVRRRFDTLQASQEWKELAAAENSVITEGPWRAGVPESLAVDRDRWSAHTAAVSEGLINLTVAQADEVSAKALRTGNNQLLTALIGSLVALLVAIAAILWAVRQSRVLVDRALSIRLARLGAEADALVDQRLPAVMERLRRREPVDLAAEFPAADYGSDEIGQVADVINRSLQVATSAAVNEAQARAAGTAMLMGVARRPQRPLQRGLKVVEDLQNQIGDEALLVDLFDIHHQLNQTRRFLENLVILAGGQIGRRFPKPMPLRRALLASFAEARNYQRITLRGATDVAVVGHAVAGFIHLMAELLDNALAFSPPATTVWVTASRVNHGVAVEIEDAGVGMTPEVVERVNYLLANAPAPDVTELKDGAQVGLYVVAELAKREGIQVSLRRSAYGGVLAVVLVPEPLLASGRDALELGAESRYLVPPPSTPPDDTHQRSLPSASEGAVPMVGRSAIGVLEPNVGGGRQSQSIGAGLTGLSSHQPNAVLAESPEPAQPAMVSAASTNPSDAARPPLPHRRPQQHLAPELREDESAGDGAGAVAAIPAPRSPEEARARFARYQRGRIEGRAGHRDEPVNDVDQGRNA